MKKLFFALALLSLLSCEGREEPRRLTLMSYNVGVFSKYADDTTPEVARLILDQGATLVGLSELDSCNARHNVFQAEALARALGPEWEYYFTRAIPFRGGAYGDGVVSSKHMISRFRIALPQGDGAEARSVAVVETEDCVFAATHLDHVSNAAAMEQMRQINDWFTVVYSGYAKPVFLCGDFNVLPESEVIALAKECWTPLSGTDVTFSTENPSICIDYLFALKDALPVEVEKCQVLREGTATLSDHFPVLLTVKY